MYEDDEEEQHLHYTTPAWCHLLVFGFALALAVLISQLCSSMA
ncbi:MULTISPECIES: hypothetical protein [Phyllobacterium]|jgi:hypothetical protein|uniref:Uncharacterized protein n=1 Tax=Phyllobacterium myrsinacearum TaxID=28101 RepID=A0A839EFS4_9HYPH|nr:MULTISPECIES: hypothetical protein [Phyllobacterium]MBA8876454.1 hypothetical protein [Phyllobacterium myrsinacearum]MBA8901082.1 hypothetical protein [Phyllobacterium sp. P30BS-XVII]SDP66101.1 hypothetical protein SAMN05443582_107170 [Phyllobacterium sp. OV277]